MPQSQPYAAFAFGVVGMVHLGSTILVQYTTGPPDAAAACSCPSIDGGISLQEVKCCSACEDDLLPGKFDQSQNVVNNYCSVLHRIWFAESNEGQQHLPQRVGHGMAGTEGVKGEAGYTE